MLIAHRSQLASGLPEQYVKFLEEEIIDRKGGFSFEGERVLVRALDEITACVPDKSIPTLMAQCNEEWEYCWARQGQEIRGNPYAPEMDGLQSAISIEDLYMKMGMFGSFLLEREVYKVPVTPFTVKTRRQVIHFGSADPVGMRKIECSPEGFPFMRGMLTKLVIGKGTVIHHVDGSRLTPR